MQDALFAIFSVWTLGAAALAVCSRRVVYSALGLGLSSLGTAALCAQAAAPLLAAGQALVFGGSAGLVCAVLFAALAVQVEEGRWRVYAPGVLAVALLALLAHFLAGHRPGDSAPVSVAAGEILFGEYALALYLVAALLLASVLAVSLLTRGGQSAEER